MNDCKKLLARYNDLKGKTTILATPFKFMSRVNVQSPNPKDILEIDNIKRRLISECKLYISSDELSQIEQG